MRKFIALFLMAIVVIILMPAQQSAEAGCKGYYSAGQYSRVHQTQRTFYSFGIGAQTYGGFGSRYGVYNGVPYYQPARYTAMGGYYVNTWGNPPRYYSGYGCPCPPATIAVQQQQAAPATQTEMPTDNIKRNYSGWRAVGQGEVVKSTTTPMTSAPVKTLRPTITTSATVITPIRSQNHGGVTNLFPSSEAIMRLFPKDTPRFNPSISLGNN